MINLSSASSSSANGDQATVLEELQFVTQIWIAVIAIRWTYSEQEDYVGTEETWIDLQMRRAMYFVFVMSFVPVIRAWFGNLWYHMFNAAMFVGVFFAAMWTWIYRPKPEAAELRD